MHSGTIVVSALATVFASVSGAGDQWNQFRGPGGRGVAPDAEALPVELGPENRLWRRAVGAGHSSPVVFGERIFLTACTGSELETLCIGRSDGAVLWRRAVTPETMERRHQVNSPASSTPVTDGERVYVYFGEVGLLCYDAGGEERWRRPMPLPENTFGSAASPVLAGDYLILNCDTNASSALLALDPATGETVWQTDRSGFGSGWSTPTLWRRDGADELLVYGVWWLTAYDLQDGAERWSVPGLSDEPCITPVTGEGLVFVTSYNMKTSPEVIGLPEFAALVKEYDADSDGELSFAEIESNESILSRNDADGEGDHPLRGFFRFLDVDRGGTITAKEWTKIVAWLNGFEHKNALVAIRPGSGAGGKGAEIAWQYTSGVPECPSPLYYDGRVYMVKNGGIATCLNAKTGELLFQERLDSRGPCYASPVVGDGKIYTASARGVVTVFEAGDTLKVLARSDLKERILATPALIGGTVYVRTEKALYAFRAPE